ncbi:MAG: putative glycoside hydrolase [Patescibacteria group bacterium]|nr:putative glycoside hydrolase [Patescibacteria group bacterium]
MTKRPPFFSKPSRIILWVAICATVIFSIYILVMPKGSTKQIELVSLPKRMPTPEEVRGIYVTSFIAAQPELRQELVNLVDRTDLNTMVIDIKDALGNLAFEPRRPTFRDIGRSDMQITDFSEWLADLHDRGIYTVARMPVFQDEALAQVHPEWAIRRQSGGVWHDWQGKAWIDPGSQEAWEYIADTAREAYDLGFDEVNFDYIRFPSDGDLSQIVYTYHRNDERRKYVTMEEFYEWLDSELNYLPIPLSVDLFGLTYVKQNQEDDMNIGQRIADAIEHFEYICPMVYASHYPAGFLGYENPAEHPYEIVKDSLTIGAEIIQEYGGDPHQSRPWIQDFNMGADYTPEMVRGQINAEREVGASGFVAWNARNIYSEEAFKNLE